MALRKAHRAEVNKNQRILHLCPISISVYRQELNVKCILPATFHISSYAATIDFVLLFGSDQPVTQGQIHKENEEKARELKCYCL